MRRPNSLPRRGFGRPERATSRRPPGYSLARSITTSTPRTIFCSRSTARASVASPNTSKRKSRGQPTRGSGSRLCFAHISRRCWIRHLTRVLIRVLPDSAPLIADRLIVLRDQYEDLIQAHIDALPLPEGTDRRLLRLFVIGAANHAQVWHRPGGQTPAEIATELARMVRASVASTEPER